MTENSPLLINNKQAATMLSVSLRTLWTHTNSGAIPSVHIGAAVRYRIADLEQWVNNGCPTTPKPTTSTQSI